MSELVTGRASCHKSLDSFSEYCRENYEPVRSDGDDDDDSVPDVIVVFRVLLSPWVLIEMLRVSIRYYCYFQSIVERIMSLCVLTEMSMIQYWMLLLFSKYCRENYEPVGSDRDVDDSVSYVIVVFRVLSREL